jgi:2-amino-4-hydroxy-6-hydroxymethyldihydropteridine diphosphokinase
MIYVSIGSNLGDSKKICEQAIDELKQRGYKIMKKSSWYRTAPVPVSNQPWFLNGVIEIETNEEPVELLSHLHEVEEKFGRQRKGLNSPRTLDLDLIAYDDKIMDNPIDLPHRRMHGRAFVLYPLKEISPNWKHPRSGASLDDLIENLPSQQSILSEEEYQKVDDK